MATESVEGLSRAFSSALADHDIENAIEFYGLLCQQLQRDGLSFVDKQKMLGAFRSSADPSAYLDFLKQRYLQENEKAYKSLAAATVRAELQSFSPRVRKEKEKEFDEIIITTDFIKSMLRRFDGEDKKFKQNNNDEIRRHIVFLERMAAEFEQLNQAIAQKMAVIKSEEAEDFLKILKNTDSVEYASLAEIVANHKEYCVRRIKELERLKIQDTAVGLVATLPLPSNVTEAKNELQDELQDELIEVSLDTPREVVVTPLASAKPVSVAVMEPGISPLRVPPVTLLQRQLVGGFIEEYFSYLQQTPPDNQRAQKVLARMDEVIGSNSVLMGLASDLYVAHREFHRKRAEEIQSDTVSQWVEEYWQKLRAKQPDGNASTAEEVQTANEARVAMEELVKQLASKLPPSEEAQNKFGSALKTVVEKKLLAESPKNLKKQTPSTKNVTALPRKSEEEMATITDFVRDYFNLLNQNKVEQAALVLADLQKYAALYNRSAILGNYLRTFNAYGLSTEEYKNLCNQYPRSEKKIKPVFSAIKEKAPSIKKSVYSVLTMFKHKPVFKSQAEKYFYEMRQSLTGWLFKPGDFLIKFLKYITEAQRGNENMSTDDKLSVIHEVTRQFLKKLTDKELMRLQSRFESEACLNLTAAANFAAGFERAQLSNGMSFRPFSKLDAFFVAFQRELMDEVHDRQWLSHQEKPAKSLVPADEMALMNTNIAPARLESRVTPRNLRGIKKFLEFVQRKEAKFALVQDEGAQATNVPGSPRTFD